MFHYIIDHIQWCQNINTAFISLSHYQCLLKDNMSIKMSHSNVNFSFQNSKQAY